MAYAAKKYQRQLTIAGFLVMSHVREQLRSMVGTASQISDPGRQSQSTEKALGADCVLS